MQLGENICKDKRIVPETHPRPKTVPVPTSWTGKTYNSQGSGQKSQEKLASVIENRQPHTEHGSRPTHEMVKVRSERIKLFPSNFTRSQDKVQEDSQITKLSSTRQGKTHNVHYPVRLPGTQTSRAMGHSNHETNPALTHGLDKNITTVLTTQHVKKLMKKNEHVRDLKDTKQS